MQRHYPYIVVLFLALSGGHSFSKESAMHDAEGAPNQSVYTLYQQIRTDDYLPAEQNYKAAHYTRPRVKRSAPSKTVMNIPISFAALGMFLLLTLLIYVVGLMLYDMTREDPVDVEGTVGKLKS